MIRQPITVEELLRWTYARQKADLITGRSLYRGEAAVERWIPETRESGDGCVAIARAGALGITISGNGPLRGGGPAPLHPGAEIVHDVVMAMRWTMAGLLITFGKSGEYPEAPPAPRYRKVVHWQDGYRVKVVVERDRKLGCSRRWCPVQIWPDQQTTVMLADRHAAWLAALDELRRRLVEVELRSFEIVDGEPAEPAAARAA